MKRKSKSPLLLLFVSVISICALVFVCLIVNQIYMQLQQPTANPNPPVNTGQTNGTVVEPPDNIPEEPQPVIQDKYITAAIKQDKTIALYNKEGQELVINLDQRNWSNIRWSPDKKFVSVLANSTPEKPDVKDMYVYDVIKQSWEKATTFQNATVGVINPEWMNNNTIFFNQGVGADNWLHSYNIESEELIKLKRYDGVINKIYNSANQVQFTQKDLKPVILDEKAEIIWDLNEGITNPDGATIALEEFFYLPELKKAYFTNNVLVPILFKIAYQDSLAFPANIISYNTMCIFNDEKILAQDQTKENITLTDIKTSRVNILYSFEAGEILLENQVNCNELSALFPIKSSDAKITWMLVEDSKSSKFSYLDNAIEVIR